MKYSYILLLACAFLYACSPKVAPSTVQTPAIPDIPVSTENFRKTAPIPGPAPIIQIGESSSFTMDNGLQVIVVENHKIPRISYSLTLKNDPILEDNAQIGTNQFAGQMFDKGTTKRSKAEIDEAIDFIGASLGTSASSLSANSLTKHTEKLLNIVTEVLFTPSFPEAELEKLRTQALSGIQAAKSNPASIAANIGSAILYGDNHPYGQVQTEESITNIQLDQCKQYFNTYFKPNNAFLTIVGDVSEARAKELAQKYFSSWKRAPVPSSAIKEVVGPATPQVVIGHKEGAVQSVINVTYPIDFKPGSADAAAVRVMNTILGGGFSSRLMQNLREDKAYTYGSRSSVSPDRIVGSFNANASVRNEVTDSSITEMLYEMERIRNNPVSETELSSIKNYISGGFSRQLESPETIARFALNAIRYNLPKDYYKNYLSRISNVTVADVQRVAQKYINPDKAFITVVGDKDQISKKILKFDGNGEIEYRDPFGKVITYDAVLPSDITGLSIVTDHVNALGGKDKLSNVQSLQVKMITNMMGQTLEFESFYKKPNKFARQVGSGGQVAQVQKFDGEKALAGAMGQNKIFTEGADFEDIKAQTEMFDQLTYLDGKHQFEVKGIETINSIKYYKMQVTNPKGDASTEYYGIEDGLLFRSISKKEDPRGGELTITLTVNEYKEVEGILFPSKVTMDGTAPIPLVLTADNIEVNGEISDAIFLIE